MQTTFENTEKVALIEPSKLKCHEHIDLDTAQALQRSMVREQVITPLLVDAKTLTILDGHHRKHVAERLLLKKVPCILVDYYHKDIQVDSWRPDIHVTKKEVIRRALSGELYPPKTSRHKISKLHALMKYNLNLIENKAQ